ncbi:MAG: tRNA preQ1(34) S-adenosylmethionine ribosyltransferase-isomerase QueA [Deltaproteobacteria bacterium]|nr:tRNA preQ1(34) S-adenosylmethionine ribosyltransferase-isomerase QueA [Deltaproteobacteria bacterium]
MKTDLFDYVLPESLIACYPPPQRDGGKLLVARAHTKTLEHTQITSLPELLPPNALVIANDSKVIPARLHARRPTGGKVEVLLVRLEETGDGYCVWNTLCKASKSIRVGDTLHFGNTATAEVTASGEMGQKILRLNQDAHDFRQYVADHGAIPLPPYIRREVTENDRDRYQTVFARFEGSVAAPTAGLHLTNDLMEKIRHKGCELDFITLHVGPGTFRPITADSTAQHQMDVEHYTISQKTARKISDAKRDGRPVIAVGTTTVRTLEGNAAKNGGNVVAGDGATDIFISPPYPFQIVDGLLTNFHLPKSTLLCLVSALAGREFILNAYKEAVARHYRFYSYGDAMLILPEPS